MAYKTTSIYFQLEKLFYLITRHEVLKILTTYILYDKTNSNAFVKPPFNVYCKNMKKDMKSVSLCNQVSDGMRLEFPQLLQWVRFHTWYCYK